MRGRKPKLRVPTEHGAYEAEGALQVAAVVVIELVRSPRALGGLLVLAGAILGVKMDVLSLVSSTLGR